MHMGIWYKLGGEIGGATDLAVIPGRGTPDGVGAWAISAMEGNQRKI